MTIVGNMSLAAGVRPPSLKLLYREPQNWGGDVHFPPQSVQNLEILITSSILGVECSDFVRFLEIIFLKFESKIEMLTWVLSKPQK